MEIGCHIFRILENGEKLLVTSVKERKHAEELVQSFAKYWPATYVIEGHLSLPSATGEIADSSQTLRRWWRLSTSFKK